MTTSADVAKLDYQAPPDPSSDVAVAPLPNTKPKRLNYGDPLRILGTMAVVLGHNVDMGLPVDVFSHHWRVLNFTDAFTRWAVPLYIMLSGALLLEPSRTENAATFYRKRLGRIGVPLVFWTAFFMWFQVEYTQWKTWPDTWRLLALGKPYVHLHFIFRIAGLYFFTPMIRVWLKFSSRRLQWTTVIGMLVLASGDTIMNGIIGNEPSVFVRFVPFLGYYLLGYLLRDTQVSALGIAWCILGAIGTCIIVAMGTELLIKKFPDPNDALNILWYPSVQMILYDFTSPPRIIMAVCVWLIFVRVFRNPWPASPTGRKIIAYWASTTLGLYLIHLAFREILFTGKLAVPWFRDGHLTMVSYQMHESFGPLWHWHGYWVGIPVVALMIYVLSLVSTIILMMIPGVRRITG